MLPEEDAAGQTTLQLLTRNPLRVAAIGAVLAATVAGFGYVGGFFTPHRLSPVRMTNALEAGGGGPHAGFRRSHAKGLCLAGSFTGTAAGRSISSAAVFAGGAIPVIGRFAEASPDPYAKDNSVGVRSMALKMLPDAGGEWRTAMNDTPGLPVSTVADFYANVVASQPDPATGKPDPARMKAFLDAHPEMVAFLARLKAKPLASGFADDSYNSVNGFLFVAPDGTRRLVRWTMQAQEPFATLDPAVRAARPDNYLFDDLIRRIGQGPVTWHLIATLAAPGDPNRAAEVWPENRPKIDMGTLTVRHVESEATGNCRDVNFDPLVLPPGMAPSDDPIVFARSAVYSESFRRRAGERKPPGAITGQSAGAGR